MIDDKIEKAANLHRFELIASMHGSTLGTPMQCFGKEDEDDKHIVHPLNFMPRKERCCELDYDLSDKGQKEKYLKQLRDSQERLKILSLLLHKQEEEVIEFGYPKTTCYYPDLNCLKEIGLKEDKQ